MAALYTCSLSLGLPSQPRIPSLGSHGRSTQTPRNTRHISSLPIQESARRVSHWSPYKCETILLVVRRVWPAIRSRQTSHTKKPQSAANIPFLLGSGWKAFNLSECLNPFHDIWQSVDCDGDQMSILYSRVRKIYDVVMMMLFELHMGKASTHS